MTAQKPTSFQITHKSLSSREEKTQKLLSSTQQELHHVDITGNLFKGLTLLIIGGSKTGKTTLIRDICSSLVDGGEMPILYCPTSREAGYPDFIPCICIQQKPTIEHYTKVYNNQKNESDMFQKRNMTNLMPLFSACANYQEQRKLAGVQALMKQNAGYLARNKTIRDKVETQIALFMDCVIAQHKDKLHAKFKNGTDLQKLLIHYAGTRKSHTICIWDDCAAYVDFFKSKEVKESSYNGRHIGITHIMSFQDLNAVPTDIRRNAHRTIFTSQSAAECYFSRATSGLDPTDRTVGSSCADMVFNVGPKQGNKHYKLLFIPNMEEGCALNDKFYAIKANPNNLKKLGSGRLWHLAEKENKLTNSSLRMTPAVNSLLRKIESRT